MSIRTLALFLLVPASVVGVFFIAHSSHAAPTFSHDVVAGELIVKLEGMPFPLRFHLPPETDLRQLAAAYARDPAVAYAEPNYRYHLAATTPNDALYSSQWNLEKIGAPAAWDIQTGSRDVVVAILDSGLDLDQPDLADNLWVNPGEVASNGVDDDGNGFADDVQGWNFIEGANLPTPALSGSYSVYAVNHGSVVAGVAGAVGNNNVGVAGASWQVQLMSIRVLDDAGVGDSFKVSQGVDYATQEGADIINLSFVGAGDSRNLADAIARAVAAGVIVVAAAGNDGMDLDTSPQYPVCYPDVVGVGSSAKDDTLSTFSNFGSSCIDLLAPGEGITSTLFQTSSNSQFSQSWGGGWQGTSVAAPLAVGVLALGRAHVPTLDPALLVEKLLDTADDVSNVNPTRTGKIGHGRLSAANFLSVLSATDLRPTSIITAPVSASSPQVKRLDRFGNVQVSFDAYAPTFRGGVSVAAGDLDGDGTDEIITGAGPGGAPHVRVFAQDGAPFSPLSRGFYPYATSFRGGVSVAAGDLDGDGTDEIITGAGPGGGPHVRVFNADGTLYALLLKGFFAYATSFRGGVNVATGDLDGDGKAEIITAPKAGGGPHVRVFNADGRPRFSFFSYATTFHGGVSVAAGDLDGDGTDEIITGAGPGGGPHVRVFKRDGTPYPSLSRGFFPYATNFKGGVNVAAGDVDGDGFDEVITGAGPGGGPHIRIFQIRDGTATPLGNFFPYASSFRGGVLVASSK